MLVVASWLNHTKIKTKGLNRPAHRKEGRGWQLQVGRQTTERLVGLLGPPEIAESCAGDMESQGRFICTCDPQGHSGTRGAGCPSEQRQVCFGHGRLGWRCV